MAVTNEDVKRAIALLQIVAEAIMDAGEIPSGHLYAAVMSHMTIEGYERCIGMLVAGKVVVKRGDLLVWVGPKRERQEIHVEVRDENSGATAQAAG
jgi:hypothetical protein